jgi:DNA (cytosine-5)-methyltransferase 1
VDLFCGAGGLTYGLSQAGIRIRVGVDIDPACRYPYTANNKAKFLLKSVGDLSGEDLSKFYLDDGVRLLAGCAPCQTFSSYNQKASQEDDRWWLLRHFGRLVEELEPDLVTMENVPGLMEHTVFDEFVKTLETADYRVSFRLVNCEEYGVPQHRKRLVLLASRFGPIELMSPEDFGRGKVSVRDVIGDGKVPKLAAGHADPNDRLHQCSALSPLNMKRMKASKPGGTWRDWEPELVAACHKKASGKTYPGVYGRMSWDDVAPTVTTQFYGFGNGRFGHPEQDRAISLREGAILQSFPPDYEFVPEGEPVQMKAIGRLIGNAVPVALGEVIGLSIKAHVKAHRDDLAFVGSRPA